MLSEFVGILFTVAIIETLNQRRADRELKARLIREMGSKDNADALKAVNEISAHEWLYDGALKYAYLSDANLSGANLCGAKLVEADLSEAFLDRANLSRADLVFADLSRAYLIEADLSEAYLGGVDLSDAKVTQEQ
jgi:uncharacterized protein YjbI with pentapeptide repeats